VRLWTVRSAQHYDRARWPLRAGVRHVDPYMLPAYHWMADQLRRRVGPPPRGVVLPLWAWVVKPDLRESAHLARGTPGVVLEVEVSAEEVLVSDFERFHAVLNRSYLERSQADADRHDRLEQRESPGGWPHTPAVRARVEKSWERVFGFSSQEMDPRHHGPASAAVRQAVFWELRREQVRSVRRFVAR
jgi:hypothetical protein